MVERTAAGERPLALRRRRTHIRSSHAEVLAPRRKSRQIKVGKVLVGGNAPVSVQSMTTTKTTDINGTLQQIAELTASGCEIVETATTVECKTPEPAKESTK